MNLRQEMHLGYMQNLSGLEYTNEI